MAAERCNSTLTSFTSINSKCFNSTNRCRRQKWLSRGPPRPQASQQPGSNNSNSHPFQLQGRWDGRRTTMRLRTSSITPTPPPPRGSGAALERTLPKSRGRLAPPAIPMPRRGPTSGRKRWTHRPRPPPPPPQVLRMQQLCSTR